MASVSRDPHPDNLYPTTLEVTFGSHQLSLDVPQGVWNPTPHGLLLGNALAELDFDGEEVLELGTGCGLHAVVIARQGAASLTLTDLSEGILDNARHNLARCVIESPIEYRVADWIRIDGGPWDSLVTNPPFAKSDKHYYRYFIDTLILEAHELVRRGGRLIFIQSSLADFPRSVRLMEECGMTVKTLAEKEQEFRHYYFEDERFLEEIEKVENSYSVRDGKRYERLKVLEGTLS